MAVGDWSTVAAENTSLGSFNLSEGVTLIGDTNGALRELMAQIAAYSATVPDGTSYMLKAAGSFSGTEPIYTGRGAYAHWSSASLTTGRMYLQATGTGMPSGAAAGTIVYEY